MKFLKQKTLSRYTPNEQTMFTNQHGRAIMNLAGGLRLPKGSTDERPYGTRDGDTGSVKTLGGINGYIRYNTDTDPVSGLDVGIEAYVGDSWQVIRAPGAAAIHIQTIGPGDSTWTITPEALDIVPAHQNNIIVLVENVIQIPGTNFTVLFDHVVPGDAYIQFESPVPLDKYVTVFFGFAN